jgi:DNA repair protein RecO (recombination protein O)
MVRLQAGGLAAGVEALPPQVGRELREALGAFIVHQLGRTLAARRFLDEVGPLLDQ